MDVAYAQPEPALRIPESERKDRVWGNVDVCVVDDRVRLVRGVLFVPVKEGGRFGWGIWAAIATDPFNFYLQHLRDDLSSEPPFEGYAANEVGLPEYADLEGHPLQVQLPTADKRPTFRLRQSEHLLSIEQQRGIDMKRVHEINRRLFPHLFEEDRG